MEDEKEQVKQEGKAAEAQEPPSLSGHDPVGDQAVADQQQEMKDPSLTVPVPGPNPKPDVNSEVYIPAIYRLHLAVSNVPELTRVTAITEPDAIIARVIGVINGGAGPMTTVEVIGEDTAADAGKFRYLCSELAKRFKQPVTMITWTVQGVTVEVIKVPAVQS